MFQNFKFEKASGIGFPKIARYCEVSICLSLASIHTSLFIVAFRPIFEAKAHICHVYDGEETMPMV